jgi:uncharacterized protein
MPVIFDGSVTFTQYATVAVVAFLASVIGGVTGYGTGLLLPPILIPIIGPEAVVPVISVSALMTNTSRLIAFWRVFDRCKATLIILCALPTCLLGAYGYTKLSGTGITLIIGIVLVVLVSFRRLSGRIQWRLRTGGMMAAAGGYGILVGGTSGSGIVLLSILLATGLTGIAAIGTDAGISLALGVVKTVVFQTAGSLPESAWVMALIIGTFAMPGVFVAKRMTRRISDKIYTVILDSVVILGSLLMIAQNVRPFLWETFGPHP